MGTVPMTSHMTVSASIPVPKSTGVPVMVSDVFVSDNSTVLQFTFTLPGPGKEMFLLLSCYSKTEYIGIPLETLQLRERLERMEFSANVGCLLISFSFGYLREPDIPSGKQTDGEGLLSPVLLSPVITAPHF